MTNPERQPAPTSENLLDPESREKLPPLYSGEELGLDALAQVKFFTPDAQWTWYASEFDGENIFFGLVNGLDLEFGYLDMWECLPLGPSGLKSPLVVKLCTSGQTSRCEIWEHS